MAQTFGDEAKQAARQLRRLPAEVRKELGRRSRTEVAEPLAQRITAAASGPYGRVIARAGAVKARNGADPLLVVGGARRVASGGANARQLVYGAEFGGGSRVTAVPGSSRRRAYRLRSTRQFIRNRSPFVFPTIRDSIPEVLDRFADIVGDVLNKEA